MRAERIGNCAKSITMIAFGDNGTRKRKRSGGKQRKGRGKGREDAACCLWTDVSVALQLGDNGRTMRRKNNGINIGIGIGIGIGKHGIGKAGLLPGVALIFPLCHTLSIVAACILDFLILSTILHTLRCVAQRRRLGSNLYFIFGDSLSSSLPCLVPPRAAAAAAGAAGSPVCPTMDAVAVVNRLPCCCTNLPIVACPRLLSAQLRVECRLDRPSQSFCSCPLFSATISCLDLCHPCNQQTD